MKIDYASKIEGYAEMSAEDKLKAIEDYDHDDKSSDITKLKTLMSKANSEAAEYKKKWQEKLSEEEKAKAEREEYDRQRDAELAAYKKQSLVAGFKAKYIGLGYENELAEATANALADNDMDTVFANQQIFIESQRKAIEIDRLNKQPDITPGGTPEIKDESEMSDAEYFAQLKKG